jgi:hypothetical protein
MCKGQELRKNILCSQASEEIKFLMSPRQGRQENVGRRINPMQTTLYLLSHVRVTTSVQQYIAIIC